jgi:2-dehydro-3-deoxygluconokinase
MKKVVTFGEVMIRLCPQENLRISQVCPGSMDLTFGGAESTVAASIAYLGGNSAFVTSLPDNFITESFLRQMKGFGVNTDSIHLTDAGRFGVYYVEKGANQRPSRVIYDREMSAVSQTKGEAYDWGRIFLNAQWLHISGITLAISETAAETALLAVKKAKEYGLKVSCDLNFRKNLWKWDPSLSSVELARKVMPKFLKYVDVVIGNEEDAENVLGIKAEDTEVNAGHISHDAYPSVAQQICKQFDNVEFVAITLRESLSANENNWGAMLYEKALDSACFSPLKEGEYSPFAINNIVDRVGGGDSFAAGLIFAFCDDSSKDLQYKLDFAVAASCLAHSIKGDFNYSKKNEVIDLMKGNQSGRVQR